jgi:hypothetical protein
MLDKGVFYSSFASATTLVFEKHPCLKHNLLMACAFLANVCMSESPDHFWRICSEMCNDACPILRTDPYEFGFAFMEEIFNRKEGKKIVSYPVKQRHQPAVNHRPSREQMDKTINCIAQLIQELRVKEAEITNTASAMHFYGKATDFLVAGAFGAGHLTAMHVLGVATCLRLMPPRFLSVAEVGITTKSWEFLKWAFGYDEATAYDDTNVLLRALAATLSIPIMLSEDLICVGTKTVAPTSKIMAQTKCSMDFVRCPINLGKKGKAGDVIYRKMKLFRLNQDCKVYYLTCNGTLLPAKPLLHENLALDFIFIRNPKFWSRARVNGKYHYKGPRPRGCNSIREYFVKKDDDDDEDEYVPRSTKRRRLATDEEHRHIAMGLMAPHPCTVLTSIQARQAMNLSTIVWHSMGGSSRGGKKMFSVRDHRLPLVRPPCVHQDYKEISKEAIFFSCCLVARPSNNKVPTTNGQYWPDPHFAMHPVCTHDPETLAPKEWRRSVVFVNLDSPDTNVKRRGSRRRYPLDHSRRTEPTYSWNCFRKAPSRDSPHGHVLAFKDKQRAMQFALLEFVFNQRQLLDLNNPQVQSLFFMPPLRLENRVNKKWRSPKAPTQISVQGANDVRIYYDTSAVHSRREKQPSLVAIKYPMGGRLYYICNGAGQRLSKPLLCRPPPSATRLQSKDDILYEFLCIAGHRWSVQIDAKQRKNVITLTIVWFDRSRTEEIMLNVFETSPFEVAYYASKHKLLDKPGWKRVRTFSNRTNQA